jgi:hypothetical protein
MGVAPDTALPWTLFSTGLRALDAGSVGLSVFLLVSIRVGDRRLRAVGTRLPEAQKLSADSWQGDIHAALPPSREDAARRQHTGALHEGGFVLRVVVRSFWLYYWPFGPVEEAVVDF